MGDSSVIVSLWKDEEYHAPLVDSDPAYQECLTSKLLLLSVVEADYPWVQKNLPQSP